MKFSFGFASGLLALGAWIGSVQAYGSSGLEVFTPMPPVRTAWGVYSGRDLNVPTGWLNPMHNFHIPVMNETFENSFGKPFVSELPEVNEPYHNVWMNLTIKSRGHQFDRLATMWIDDTEIMRLSTPQPTEDGVASFIVKDLTQFMALFTPTSSEPQTPKKFIFDLGNLVDDAYDAPIHVTVDLYFHRPTENEYHCVADDVRPFPLQFTPAQHIIPVSASRGSTEGQSSVWNFPSDKAETKIRVPKDAGRAVFTVAATGQGNEEFWWSKVPESAAGYYGNSTDERLPGLSSFREVRVYVDDMEAGYAWPFPVVFTGGISPALHRPVAGIQAFDLREYEIDFTLWLHLLSDGEEHTIRMEVWGVEDSDPKNPTFVQVGGDWLLSGKLFVWDPLDIPSDDAIAFHKGDRQLHDADENTPSTSRVKRIAEDAEEFWGADETRPDGRVPQVTSNPIDYKSKVKPLKNEEGAFRYSQSISREITIKLPDPKKYDKFNRKTQASWTSQEYKMENKGVFKDWAKTQEVKTKYNGESKSSLRGEKQLATLFGYEIETLASYNTTDDVMNLEAVLDHAYRMAVTNHSPLAEGAFGVGKMTCGKSPGTWVYSHKVGTAEFTRHPDGSTEGQGTTHHKYNLAAMGNDKSLFIGPPGKNWYRREIRYDSDKPISDTQWYLGYHGMTLSDGGTVSHEDFMPHERIHGPETLQNGTIQHSSHIPSDYAPYPLARSGLPNIHL